MFVPQTKVSSDTAAKKLMVMWLLCRYSKSILLLFFFFNFQNAFCWMSHDSVWWTKVIAVISIVRVQMWKAPVPVQVPGKDSKLPDLYLDRKHRRTPTKMSQHSTSALKWGTVTQAVCRFRQDARFQTHHSLKDCLWTEEACGPWALVTGDPVSGDQSLPFDSSPIKQH